jgi:ubiquinone/menaquinone biosynthesis C-methylase UbiE
MVTADVHTAGRLLKNLERRQSYVRLSGLQCSPALHRCEKKPMRERETIEQQVARHYARSDLEQTILDALIASGKDPERLTPDDLSPVDEFHTGGRHATMELAALMDLTPAMHLLDVGCGIGGPSRSIAAAHGCRITGIDLTEEFVRAAEALSRRVGLAGRVVYRQANALSLPFEPATFDGAYMMHVGMNIADKPALFAEVRRVLKPGGLFALYDAMQTGEGALAFPVHWAATPATSFVDSPAAYRGGLQAAGFEIVRECDRREYARQCFREIQARIAEHGPPPLGTHILLKSDVAEKLANVVRNLEQGLIAPIEIVCRARP